MTVILTKLEVIQDEQRNHREMLQQIMLHAASIILTKLEVIQEEQRNHREMLQQIMLHAASIILTKLEVIQEEQRNHCEMLQQIMLHATSSSSNFTTRQDDMSSLREIIEKPYDSVEGLTKIANKLQEEPVFFKKMVSQTVKLIS